MINIGGNKCCPKPTLPEMLGITGLIKGTAAVAGGLFTRFRGTLSQYFPQLNAMPGPVLPADHPSNQSKTASPAQQEAAKSAEKKKQAAQKTATYKSLENAEEPPKGEKADEIFLSGLDDIAEVRLAAVKAIYANCRTCMCTDCDPSTCCTPKIRRKLLELTDICKEKNRDVRLFANLALRCCGAPMDEGTVDGPGGTPKETPPPIDIRQNGKQPGPVEAATGRDVRQVGFESSAAGPVYRGVVATVNGRPIDAGRFEAIVRRTLDGLPAGSSDSATHRAIERDVLGDLLREQLVRQNAPYELQSRGELSTGEILQLQRPSPAVSESELRTYYEAHPEEFEFPAEVRWEMLTVPRKIFRDAQRAAVVVQFLEARAKGRDVDPPQWLVADMIDWTSARWSRRRDMPSDLIAHTAFALRVDQVSPVIEDEHGWHMVRLLERRRADRVPYVKAVPEIHRKLTLQRRRIADKRYVDELWKNAHIWTVFDGTKPAGGAHFVRN